MWNDFHSTCVRAVLLPRGNTNSWKFQTCLHFLWSHVTESKHSYGVLITQSTEVSHEQNVLLNKGAQHLRMFRGDIFTAVEPACASLILFAAVYMPWATSFCYLSSLLMSFQLNSSSQVQNSIFSVLIPEAVANRPLPSQIDPSVNEGIISI